MLVGFILSATFHFILANIIATVYSLGMDIIQNNKIPYYLFINMICSMYVGTVVYHDYF